MKFFRVELLSRNRGIKMSNVSAIKKEMEKDRQPLGERNKKKDTRMKTGLGLRTQEISRFWSALWLRYHQDRGCPSDYQVSVFPRWLLVRATFIFGLVFRYRSDDTGIPKQSRSIGGVSFDRRWASLVSRTSIVQASWNSLCPVASCSSANGGTGCVLW